MSAACPVCGFDGSSVSPADAAVALRSFPRRYRGVLVRPADENEAEDPVRRRGADGWSALDHATWVVSALDDIGHQLQQVLVHDHPSISPPPVDPPSPPAPSTSLDTSPATVLDRLTTGTSALAATVDGTSAGQWSRAGTAAGGASVTAVDLVRLAVHQAVHHLRAAEHVLREVVGRP